MAFQILSESNSEELFGIIDSAITLAASQWPKELTSRRNALIQKLLAVVNEDGDDDGSSVVTKESSMNSQHTMNNNNNNNVNEHVVPSLPKKRFIIRIKLPQQTKPTIEAVATTQEEAVVIKPTIEAAPTSQEEALVKGGGGGGDQPNKLKQELEQEEKFQLKLEATKRKLQQRYQQAQDSKKRIRVVELKDVPKQELLEGSNKKPRNRYRW